MRLSIRYKICDKHLKRYTNKSYRFKQRKRPPVKEQVTKISESIKGFHARIIYLEAHMTLRTPPKERDK
jgi:hypothetical protein